MAPQACKVINTHAHGFSRWAILSILLHVRAPQIGGVNGYVQSDIATLSFNNGEKIKYFYGRILRIQQEIILSGETFYLRRFIFEYMKALSKIYKLKAFITPKMTYIITFLDNNGKPAVYTGGNVHRLYCYL